MTTAGERTGTCPVLNFDYTEVKPAGTWMKTYDDLRAKYPWFRNEFGPGFWTVVNYGGSCRSCRTLRCSPTVW